MKKFALFVGALSLATAAYAIVPLVFLLSALNLHLAAGLILDYMARDIKATSTSQPVRVYIKTNNDAPSDDSQLAPAAGFVQSAPPVQVTRPVSGGSVSVSLPTYNPATGTFTWTPVSVNPETLGSMLANATAHGMVYAGTSSCPAGSAGYKCLSSSYAGQTYTVTRSVTTAATNVYTQFCTTSGCGYTQTQVPAGTVIASIAFATGSIAGSFQINDAISGTCPSGYSPDPNYIDKCTLTDANLAKNGGSLADGKCVVAQGSPNPFDPDCRALQDVGAITTGSDGNGGTVTQVKNPGVPTDPTVTSVQPKSDGGQQVSQSSPGPDGSGSLQTTPVGPGGQVGTTTGTNYPGSPAPQYPGQSGTGAGSGTGGTSTQVGGGCGGANQDKCAVQVEPGDIVEKTPGAMGEEITGSLDSLKQKSIGTSSSCPANIFSFTMPLPNIVGGPMFVSDSGVFCDVMSDYQDLFRTVSIASAWIMAMFIVLRA